MQPKSLLTGNTEAIRNCDMTSHLFRVRLTKTEVKVLGHIRQGHSSQEAADILMVSKRTVDFHLANIYRKLQVKNRVQALVEAGKLGLLPDIHSSEVYQS